MEPLFQHLVVGLVPQQRQQPLKPFASEDLQRLFADVIRSHPYAQFAFMQAEGGAQMANGPDDVAIFQPGLLQVRTTVMTTGQAREKVTTVLGAAARRLGINHFMLAGLKVIATIPAPGAAPDAKAFVTEQLLHASDHAAELGTGFFGGGVKFRRIEEEESREDVLLIEPFVQDNTMLFIDYDVQRAVPIAGLDSLPGWIDEAFDFVAGPTVRILEEHDA